MDIFSGASQYCYVKSMLPLTWFTGLFFSYVLPDSKFIIMKRMLTATERPKLAKVKFSI